MEELTGEKFDEWAAPELKEIVTPENELKTWLVSYVGNKHNPDNGNVTVEMIVETLAEEFPEFTMAVAGENFLRGYHQALCDAQLTDENTNNNTQT